ncbi:MAG: hypothetical protein QOF61_195 [Acidobacteriota bacterium]|jgi:hypothetical protein|nr:hypothetical protein [Acidobacteriota bacterium]
MRFRRPRPRLAVFVGFLIIVGMVCLNRWLFRVAFRTDYFLWYLKNGALISLATGFLKLVWDGMKARLGLISTHPAAYIAACLQLLGVFTLSLSPARRRQRLRPKEVAFDIGLNSAASRALDEILYFFLAFVMLLLCVGWVLCVAPLVYFVTLVAGVPARQELRGKLAPTYIHEQGGQVEVFETDEEIDLYASGKMPEKAVGLSFARDPFAVTQAMTALILWLAGLAYGMIK